MNAKTKNIADEIGAEIEALLSSGKPLSDPGKGLCLKTPGKLSVKAGTLSSRADLPIGYTREQAIEQAASLLGAGKVSARNEIARGDDDAIQASHASSTMSEASRSDRVLAIARIARLLPDNERQHAIETFKASAATALVANVSEVAPDGLSSSMAESRKQVAQTLLDRSDCSESDRAELQNMINLTSWRDESEGDATIEAIRAGQAVELEV